VLPLLYMVRHGLTDWNAEARLQGQADTDINDEGRAQADRNGRRLAELLQDPVSFDYVASPLRRTRETMERVRRQLGLAPDCFRTDPLLKEVHFGAWQGFTYIELEAREPGCTAGRARDKWHFLPPGAEAESYEILARRVRTWLDGLERPTVCVTHGGVMRTVFYWLEGLSPEEAAEMDIPQDKLLRMENGKLEWL
jgi:broad specificity phosphatase PhoE